MKRNDWIVISSMMFLSVVASVFLTVFLMNKYIVPKVKTVSIMNVLNDKEDESYQNFLDGKISQEEYSKLVETKMAKIQSGLDYFTSKNDILLVEEAVIKTNSNNYISITEAVKNHLTIKSSSKYKALSKLWSYSYCLFGLVVSAKIAIPCKLDFSNKSKISLIKSS